MLQSDSILRSMNRTQQQDWSHQQSKAWSSFSFPSFSQDIERFPSSQPAYVYASLYCGRGLIWSLLFVRTE